MSLAAGEATSDPEPVDGEPGHRDGGSAHGVRQVVAMSPWPKAWPMRVLAALWSSVWGILGLVGAGLFVVFGWGKLRARSGAVEVWARGPLANWLCDQNWAAFTLGWTIFSWTGEPDPVTQVHERIHVRQYLCWGPLMAPAYGLMQLIYTYKFNPFEVAAYKADGRGKAP